MLLSDDKVWYRLVRNMVHDLYGKQPMLSRGMTDSQSARRRLQVSLDHFVASLFSNRALAVLAKMEFRMPSPYDAPSRMNSRFLSSVRPRDNIPACRIRPIPHFVLSAKWTDLISPYGIRKVFGPCISSLKAGPPGDISGSSSSSSTGL